MALLNSFIKFIEAVNAYCKENIKDIVHVLSLFCTIVIIIIMALNLETVNETLEVMKQTVGVMEAQRARSIKPNIALTKTEYMVYRNHKPSISGFPSFFTTNKELFYSEIKNMEALNRLQDCFSDINIEIYNIASSPARNVELTWIIEYDKIVGLLNKYKEYNEFKIFPQEEGFQSSLKFMNKTIDVNIHLGNLEAKKFNFKNKQDAITMHRSIPYIPADRGKNNEKIVLPRGYTYFLSLYFGLLDELDRQKQKTLYPYLGEFKAIPIKIAITYEDIEGRKYSSFFYIKNSFQGVAHPKESGDPSLFCRGTLTPIYLSGEDKFVEMYEEGL